MPGGRNKDAIQAAPGRTSTFHASRLVGAAAAADPAAGRYEVVTVMPICVYGYHNICTSMHYALRLDSIVMNT